MISKYLIVICFIFLIAGTTALNYASPSLPKLEKESVIGDNYYNISNVTNIYENASDWSSYPATNNVDMDFKNITGIEYIETRLLNVTEEMSLAGLKITQRYSQPGPLSNVKYSGFSVGGFIYNNLSSLGLLTGCNYGNNWCNGTDVNMDGDTNGADIIFIRNIPTMALGGSKGYAYTSLSWGLNTKTNESAFRSVIIGDSLPQLYNWTAVRIGSGDVYFDIINTTGEMKMYGNITSTGKICDSVGCIGTGGNIFNQVLNTTSNVTFNNVSVTSSLSVNGATTTGNITIGGSSVLTSSAVRIFVAGGDSMLFDSTGITTYKNIIPNSATTLGNSTKRFGGIYSNTYYDNSGTYPASNNIVTLSTAQTITGLKTVGNMTFSAVTPFINITDTTAGANDWQIVGVDDILRFRDTVANINMLNLDGARNQITINSTITDVYGNVNITGNLDIGGNVFTKSGYRVNSSVGISGSWNCTSYPNVTIVGGIVTSWSC